MKDRIAFSVKESLRAVAKLQEPYALRFIEQAAGLIFSCFRNGNKVLIAGNGGSLCDASHFAEELTGFFRSRQRGALPAIALNDSGHITCCGNDVGFDQVFSRYLEALGRKGDIFVALTTSGNSANIVNALSTAQKLGLRTIAFLGKDGGKMRGEADLEWIVDGFKTSDRVQEAHMAAIHIIIEMVEYLIYSGEKDRLRLSDECEDRVSTCAQLR